MIARVKISQTVDILPKVYLLHLKVKHCHTLCVVSTITGQNELTVFDKALPCIVEGGQKMTVKTSQKCPC